MSRKQESRFGGDTSTEVGRVLIHAAYPLWRKHMLMTIARAKELRDQGNAVTLTYCNASRGTCAVNYMGNRLTCHVCKSRVRAMARDAGLPVIPLETGSPSEVSERSDQELREGVQSGITSTFRTLPADSDIVPRIRAIKYRYQQTARGLLESIQGAIRSIRPTRLEVFSGRHACSRFVLIAARDAGLPFNTLEITSTRRPIIFDGHTPHDRKQLQRRIRSHPADMRLADQYYQRRRAPKNNKYARGYANRFEPPDDRHNYRQKIAVFLSSQDEFGALGKDWESPFDDYASVVEQLSQQHPDCLFCVRFHPNQAEITSDVITPFEALSNRPNVRVFYPGDSINSYRLIEWSDTVLTFGSTVTVEACWMGKPVVLLGPSFFDELSVAYTPETVGDAIELLRGELEPQDRTGAAQFASYALHDGNSFKYIDPGQRFESPEIRIKHRALGWLLRTADNFACHAVRKWIRVPKASANRPSHAA